MHNINLEEDFKVAQPQRRLNPVMKEEEKKYRSFLKLE